MAKSFTGSLPKTGFQRNAEQVAARLNDLLGYVNEIFILGDDPLNYNKLLGFDGSGDLTVSSPFNAPTTAADGQTIIFDAPNSEFIAANSVTGSDKNYVLGPDGTAGQAVITDGAGNLTFVDFPNTATVNGTDKTYDIGPDGTAGQAIITDGAGNLTFVDFPQPTITFENVTGNFTAEDQHYYNIDAGAQITINTADVNSTFMFKFRPKYGQNFTANNPVILYNGVNLFQGLAEDINVDLNLQYTIYSQNGTVLQASAEGLTEDG